MENFTQDEPNNSSEPSLVASSKLVYVFIGVVVVGLIAAGYYLYSSDVLRNYGMPAVTSTDESRPSARLSTRSGDYEAAAEVMRNIVADENADPEQRAAVVSNAAGANFKLTGNIEDALVSIQELKKVSVDEQVSARLRAQSITTMGGIYYGSAGRHPLVFKEIFSGEPFSQYLVEGNSYLSIRNLLEWAHSIHPTSNTAIKIAQWYVVEPFQDNSLSQADIVAYLSEARRYLSEAENLTEQNPVSTDSRRYASDLYWTEFVNTAIAYLEDSPNKHEYRKKYEDLIGFLEASKNTEVRQYIPYTYWLYANWLVMFDNDTEVARAQLNQVVAFMQSDPKPEVTEFAKFLEYTPTGGEYAKDNNFFTRMILDMMALDDDFRDYVATINPGLLLDF